MHSYQHSHFHDPFVMVVLLDLLSKSFVIMWMWAGGWKFYSIVQIASFMTRPHCGIWKWATLEFLPVCEATPNDHLKPTDSTVLLISYNAKICLFRYCWGLHFIYVIILYGMLWSISWSSEKGLTDLIGNQARFDIVNCRPYQSEK